MAEYKDTTKLAKEISDFKKSVNSPNSDYLQGYLCALSVTEGIIASTPTADVVEVVRCKDCKWCKLCYPAKAIGEEAIDEYYCNMFKQYRLPDNYCSYGERK